MSNVRVHLGSSKPAEVNARAFASGPDIHVAPGEERHLPHEAWHVVQQRQGRVRPTGTVGGLPLNDDPALEREATVQGNAALEREADDRPRVTGEQSSGARRQPAAVVQRVGMTKRDYLQEVRANGLKKPEEQWDPEWTAAINEIMTLPTDTSYFLAENVDPDNKSDVQKFVKQLGQLAPLSKKPVVFGKVQLAVRAVAEIPSTTVRTGFRKLKVTIPSDGATTVEGRPSFPKVTYDYVYAAPGEHRRHILPSHSIRAFVQTAHRAFPAEVKMAIADKIENPDPVAKLAVDEGKKLVLKGTDRPLKDDEILKIGIYVMNGNPRNLWAGKGKVNVAANSTALAMKGALKPLTDNEQLKALGDLWHEKSSDKKLSQTYRVTAKLVSDYIRRAREVRKSRGLHLTPQKKGEAAPAETAKHPVSPTPEEKASGSFQAQDEPGWVKAVIKEIEQLFVGNLELDILAGTKKKMTEALGKYKILKEPIRLMDEVANQGKDIKKLDAQAVAAAIGEFMTYQK